jgi:potassium efflux system protein
MQGQEYKMVPIEAEQKSIAEPAAVPPAAKDAPEPPDVRLD